MNLFVDPSAIAHNAALIRQRAEAVGLDVVAAVKEPFATTPVLEAVASAGVRVFGFSSPGSARLLSFRAGQRCDLISLALPAEGDAVVGHLDLSIHTSEETIRAFAAVATRAAHGVWLGILTSDDREGIPAEELLDKITALNRDFTHGLTLHGLLAHWGCHFEISPRVAEIDSVIEIAAALGQKLGRRPLPVSLGGSVLLPLLEQCQCPPGTELRIGEAILTGTIPGNAGRFEGLRRCFFMDAQVLEVRVRRAGTQLQPHVFVNCGSAVLDRDIELVGMEGRAMWSSSGMTSVELVDTSTLPKVGDTLKFALGYQSAARALSTGMRAQRAVREHWSRADPSENLTLQPALCPSSAA